MTVTIYTLNFMSDHRPDAPFNVSFHPPDADQNAKVTPFIGHPLDRRSPPDTTKQWPVVVPDSAALEGDKLKWPQDGEVRWLTAVEVYSLAQKGLHGFRLADG